MNEKIHEFSMERSAKKEKKSTRKGNSDDDPPDGAPENKGNFIFDAAACPQDIAYPTDHQLLNKSREITEWIIDILHHRKKDGKKNKDISAKCP